MIVEGDIPAIILFLWIKLSLIGGCDELNSVKDILHFPIICRLTFCLYWDTVYENHVRVLQLSEYCFRDSSCAQVSVPIASPLIVWILLSFRAYRNSVINSFPYFELFLVPTILIFVLWWSNFPF